MSNKEQENQIHVFLIWSLETLFSGFPSAVEVLGSSSLSDLYLGLSYILHQEGGSERRRNDLADCLFDPLAVQRKEKKKMKGNGGSVQPSGIGLTLQWAVPT